MEPKQAEQAPRSAATGLAVGRDVHYVAPGSADGTYPRAHRAAKVTVVQEREHGIINAIVFNPTGIHFVADLRYDGSAEPAPFTWHWPEYVP